MWALISIGYLIGTLGTLLLGWYMGKREPTAASNILIVCWTIATLSAGGIVLANLFMLISGNGTF